MQTKIGFLKLNMKGNLEGDIQIYGEKSEISVGRFEEFEEKVSGIQIKIAREGPVLGEALERLGVPNLQITGSKKDDHRLLLRIHFFKNFGHLIALLGRVSAASLARRLPRGFKSIKARFWIPLPIRLKIKGSFFGVSLQPIDWASCDSTASDLGELCKRFDIEPPRGALKNFLIFAELYKSQQKFIGSIGQKFGIDRPQQFFPQKSPYSIGTVASRLLGAWLLKKAPLSRDLIAALDVSKVGSPCAADLFSTLYGIEPLIEKTDSELTKCFLGIVLGGRIGREHTKNPKPNEMIIDLDIVSAYGTAMTLLMIPIGHPTILYFAHHHKDDWPTLGEFLKKWKDELVEFGWLAVFDTLEPLGFHQDFFLSKLVDEPELDEDEEGPAHVSGPSCILAEEIKNGVLTTSSLSLLQSVATRSEWSDLRKKIKVKSAIIYPRSAKKANFDDWKRAILQNQNRIRTFADIEGHGLNDFRTGAWFGVNLRDFVGPLLEDRRNSPKKKGKHLKAIVNAVYGSISNPFFDFNHPMIANQITDIVRCVVWLMAKNSNAFLSITDGVVAPLNAMASRRRGLAYRGNSRRTEPLGGLQWSINGDNQIEQGGHIVENPVGLCERLFNERLFTSVQGSFQKKILTHFSIAVKGIGRRFGAHSSADYVFWDWIKQKDIIKFRSQTLNTPHFAINAKAGDPPVVPAGQLFLRERQAGQRRSRLFLPTFHQKIATLGDFQNQKGRETFLAGDPISKKNWLRVITASQFRYLTARSRQQWAKKYYKLSHEYRVGLEASYIDPNSLEFDLVAAESDIQSRILEGLSPKRLSTDQKKVFNDRWKSATLQQEPTEHQRASETRKQLRKKIDRADDRQIRFWTDLIDRIDQLDLSDAERARFLQYVVSASSEAITGSCLTF